MEPSKIAEWSFVRGLLGLKPSSTLGERKQNLFVLSEELRQGRPVGDLEEHTISPERQEEHHTLSIHMM